MRLFAPLLALSLIASSAAAAAPTTLRIVVTGHEGEEVNVNVPLCLASSLASMAPIEKSKGGRIRVGDRDLDVAELRTLWAQVKDGGDAELLSVKDAGGKVKVSTRRGHVLVNIVDADSSTVRVDLPHSVVDALLSGTGDELDISAAIAKLSDLSAGEIVRVDDGDDHVSISLQ